MKGTMDGAAKSADKVAQRILPDRPHHLSVSLTRRFPAPKGFWYTGQSAPLQYMTYVSEASRGILLTRPSYDIYEETEVAPATMPAKVLAKGEVKKKMSIKDYQNRKKSVSPTDQELAAKAEAKANGVPELKLPKENRKVEPVKSKEKVPDKPPNPPNHETRTEKPRLEVNGESARGSQPSKQQPEPASRKRLSEAGDHPPQKRPRLEHDNRVDPSNRLRPETPRGRDRANEKPQKDIRDSLHPLGHEIPSSNLDRDVSASPKSTIQVNGTRPHPNSATSTPRRGDAPTKTSLPALLSPLHPSILSGILDERGSSRKRPAEKPSAKAFKPDGPLPTKKAKTSVKIPELLSPTLPPIIEAELARVKKTPSKGDVSQASRGVSESPSSARKSRVVADHVDEEAPPTRPSRIVTFKLKKANAKRAKDLLSLPSKSFKNALRKERRSESVDNTPPPARKRPRIDEPLVENIPPKRSKLTSEMLGGPKPSGLSTPLKQTATAMSRVTSNQSQGNTPGNTAGLTPGTAERRPISYDGPPDNSSTGIKNRQAVDSLRERHEEYRKLGSTLKHTRDDLARSSGPNLSSSDEKRIASLHLEMILAYMVAFHSINQARALDRKVLDVTMWESLIPHLHELQSRPVVASNRALKVLALQMHALCLEQITNAYTTLDPATAASRFKGWAKLDRSRLLIWADSASQADGIGDGRMKTPIGPWTKIDEAVGAVLNVMRRWAEREGVHWRPVILRDRDRDKERERERGPNGTARN